MSDIFDVGDEVRLFALFEDDEGDAVDPTVVSLSVRKPDGVSVPYTYPDGIQKDTVGAYHFDVTPDQAGYWQYEYSSSGNLTTSQTDYFIAKDE